MGEKMGPDPAAMAVRQAIIDSSERAAWQRSILTAREIEVPSLVEQGLTNAAIAAELGIAEMTITTTSQPCFDLSPRTPNCQHEGSPFSSVQQIARSTSSGWDWPPLAPAGAMAWPHIVHWSLRR